MTYTPVKTLDGLAVGTIRNKKWNTEEVPAEKWCKGAPIDSPWHRWSNTIIKFCTICGADKYPRASQIEEETLG
jgi:hypothetical protein